MCVYKLSFIFIQLEKSNMEMEVVANRLSISIRRVHFNYSSTRAHLQRSAWMTCHMNMMQLFTHPDWIGLNYALAMLFSFFFLFFFRFSLINCKKKKNWEILYLLYYIFQWVPISSTDKVSDSWIRELKFNLRLYKKPISILIWW